MFIQEIAFENVICEMASFCLGFNVLNIDDMDKYQPTTKTLHNTQSKPCAHFVGCITCVIEYIANAILFARRFTGKDLYLSRTQPRKIYNRLYCGTRQGLVRTYFSVRRILNSTGYCKLPG